MSFTHCNSKGYFALVDCNNFYASCERLFNPDLERRPVVVLSNNDGCVIARSQEAKGLGIKMGDPYFKIKNFCQYNNVVVRSSNYALYGDLSHRVMSVLAMNAPEIEVYSIDEAFLRYPTEMGVEGIMSQCDQLRAMTKQWVGVPVSVGIAPTKTLAKLANFLAKKEASGVFELVTPGSEERLKKIYVQDVWGVGAASKSTLNAMGIHTAWDLRTADPAAIRRKMGVVGERMVWELRGVRCFDLEQPEPRKNITCSRSFGKYVTCQDELAEALSTYVNTACGKLRKQGSCASAAHVFVEVITEEYKGQGACFGATVSFSVPTNDTSQIITAAKRCLKELYREGCRYKKCGVMLLGLVAVGTIPLDFFSPGVDKKREGLQRALDGINKQFGKNTVFYAAMGTDPSWKVRADHCSGSFTTSWDGLAVVQG